MDAHTFRDRMDDVAGALRRHPGVRVLSSWARPPIVEDALVAIEQAAGIRLPDELRALYLVCDGMGLLWVPTTHPLYDAAAFDAFDVEAAVRARQRNFAPGEIDLRDIEPLPIRPWGVYLTRAARLLGEPIDTATGHAASMHPSYAIDRIDDHRPVLLVDDVLALGDDHGVCTFASRLGVGDFFESIIDGLGTTPLRDRRFGVEVTTPWSTLGDPSPLDRIVAAAAEIGAA